MLVTKQLLSPMDVVSKRALVAVAAGVVVTAGSGLGAKNLAGSGGPSSSTAPPAVSAQASARGAAESDAARHRAVLDLQLLEGGEVITPDLGGRSRTQAVAEMVG